MKAELNATVLFSSSDYAVCVLLVRSAYVCVFQTDQRADGLVEWGAQGVAVELQSQLLTPLHKEGEHVSGHGKHQHHQTQAAEDKRELTLCSWLDSVYGALAPLQECTFSPS